MTETKTRETAASPPPPPDSPVLPKLGFVGGLRFVWAQLSSMRTALVLLFALALAAIPGSLIPQKKVSPVRVSDFVAAHPTLGPIYERVGLFDVYSSPWFSAIYLLLFVSLIGCIIPRVGVYGRALRHRPPKIPRNLHRLPAYARVPAAGPDVLERAAASLKRQHYRVDVSDGTVAAERGYLREAGNLVFHISLLFVLLGVAIGGLYGFRGTSVVIAGQGFSNNQTQYDDLTAGAWFTDADFEPFNVTVKDFQVKFETGPVQRGAARLFRADVEVTDAPGAQPHAEVLEVNKPLNINGTTVHLIGHGYAPRVTVKDGDGNVAFSGPVVFLPQDGNFMSAGAIKAPDGRPERLAFQGFFLPTAVRTSETAAPSSAFPDAVNPVLYVSAYSGPPKVETGRPENVYSLDLTGLTPIKDAAGAPLRIALQPGTVFDLPNGQGSIQLDGWDRWVKLQVGDAPGVAISLVAIGFAVLGLCLSLFVRPRRVWVRFTPGDDSPGWVEVGGLDRADARAGLTEDVAELAADLAGEPPRIDVPQEASSNR